MERHVFFAFGYYSFCMYADAFEGISIYRNVNILAGLAWQLELLVNAGGKEHFLLPVVEVLGKLRGSQPLGSRLNTLQKALQFHLCL